MEFIETPIFTKQMTELLNDESYSELQQVLIKHPEAGVLIKGGAGLRKLRWALQGKGKSGGIRIMYYYMVCKEECHMLYLFQKNEADNLTDKQVMQLAKYIKEIR